MAYQAHVHPRRIGSQSHAFAASQSMRLHKAWDRIIQQLLCRCDFNAYLSTHTYLVPNRRCQAPDERKYIETRNTSGGGGDTKRPNARQHAARHSTTPEWQCYRCIILGVQCAISQQQHDTSCTRVEMNAHEYVRGGCGI